MQRRASVDPLVRPLWDKQVDALTGARQCIDEAPSMRWRSPVVVRPVFRLFGNPDAPAPDIQSAPLLPAHGAALQVVGPATSLANRRCCLGYARMDADRMFTILIDDDKIVVVAHDFIIQTVAPFIWKSQVLPFKKFLPDYKVVGSPDIPEGDGVEVGIVALHGHEGQVITPRTCEGIRLLN